MLKFTLILVLYISIIFLLAFITLKQAHINPHAKFVKYPIYCILPVKNQEENIEGIIRHFARKTLADKNQFTELIIINLDSTDETLSILHVLSKEYPFVHILSKDEYITFIESLD